ncbi:hypothetical protein, partial [uncultured Bacteroides sp.]|uniref:hypothetical protein n=1 Tax=uncultured Bacteroides sp. TaxID=162156 RepID=UPI002595809A
NTETSFASQWRATPFGVTFESVDYKEDEHSNHVIRSFITSSVRLSYKKGNVSGWRIPFSFRSFQDHSGPLFQVEIGPN